MNPAIKEAAQWYRRHREDDLTAAEREAFLCWLRLSPHNTHEYLGMAELWGGLKDAVADLEWNETDLVDAMAAAPAQVVSLKSTPPPRTRGGYPLRRAGLIAASFLLVVAAVYQFAPAGLVGRPQVYMAGPDRPDRVHLDDGSTLHLNRNARVKVRYTFGQRRLELDRGEAFFDVAREVNRPFRVRVGATDVLAVGTRFDISRRGDHAFTLTVIEGRVDVGALQLTAGEQVHIEGTSHSRPTRVDLRAATAWMRRELIFDDARLAEVVEQFNRYLKVPVRIGSAALGDLRISGVFDAYDAETFLALLRQQDIHIQQHADIVTLSLNK